MKMKASKLQKTRLANNVAAAVLLIAAASSHADTEKYSIDIKAQKAGSALVALGESAGVQISIPNSLASRVKLNSLKGEFTLSEALEQLLSGSGLVYKFVDDSSVVVSEAEAAEASTAKKKDTQEVEEIVVTGSALIQDPGKLTRQTTTFTREDIENSGLTRLDDFLNLLPQNLNAPTNVGSGDFKNQTFGLGKNVYGGSSANLRGLGALYTLILIDGKRPTAGGQFGEITDISNIPIDSVDRIEILFDGAAAIYGADAVGGVINIITRKSYQGTNVSMTLTGTEDGGGEQLNASVGHTFGWDSGRFTTSFNFQGQKPIDGSQRGIAFTPDAAADFLVEPAKDGNLVSSYSTRALMFIKDLNGDGDYDDEGERLGGGTENGRYGITGGIPYYSPRSISGMEADGWEPIFAIGLPEDGFPDDLYGFDLSNFDPENPEALLNPRGDLPLQNFSLKPKDSTYGLSMSLYQELSDRLSVKLDSSYRETEKQSFTSNQDRQDILGTRSLYQTLFGTPFRRAFQVDLPTQNQEIEIRNYSFSAGFDYELTDKWNMSGGLAWGLSRSESRTNDRLNSRGVIYDTLMDGMVNVRGDNPNTPEVDGAVVGDTYEHPLYGPVTVSSIYRGYARFVNPNDGSQDYLIEAVPGYWEPNMGFSSQDELAEYITDKNVLTSTRSTNKSANLALQGTLFDTAAGGVRARLAARYRQTESHAMNNNSDLPSYMFTTGTNDKADGASGMFFPSGTIQKAYDKRYGRDTATLSGEIAVPLVSSDMSIPFVDSFLVNAASSTEAYSKVDMRGNNWSMGMNWGVNDWMTVRLNRNYSLRVPSSVRSATETQWSFYELGLNNTRPSGFPAFAAMRALRGGSEELRPERNFGTALSFIFTPTFVDGMKIKVNARKSDTYDRIGTPRVGLDNWLDDYLNPEFVALHPLFLTDVGDYTEDADANANYRLSYAVIDGADLREYPIVFDARQRNVGDVSNSGIDFEVNYRADTDFGDFVASWRHTYTLKNLITRENLCEGKPEDVCSVRAGIVFTEDTEMYDYTQPVDTVDTVDRRRRVKDFPLPAHRGSVQLTWNYRGLSVTGTTTYQADTHALEELRITDEETGERPFVALEATTKAASALTLSMGYDFGKGDLFEVPSWLDKTRLRLSVSNAYVFQENEIERKRLDNGGPVGFSRATYYNPHAIDPYGRRYVLSLNKSFN
ncbi:TonB-dependent receptor plug domain-containing protein [Porticoccaceae bacterium LTM1]|nr:TonB-dependent receptor plug domain-containing protein [Porticoccaceae bacterium LTM1]